MSGLKCCRRCGHQNEARARFCAQCGLRLLDSEDALERVVKAHSRHTGRTVVLLLLLGALALAVVNAALAARYGRAHHRLFMPPRPVRVTHDGSCRFPADAYNECPYLRSWAHAYQRCPYLALRESPPPAFQHSDQRVAYAGADQR